jgi:hypothetical protein
MLQQSIEPHSNDTWCKGQSQKRTPQKTHNNHVVVCSISALDLLCCVPHGMQLCLGLVLHVCMWCALNCHSCLLLMMFWCCVCVCVCVYVCMCVRVAVAWHCEQGWDSRHWDSPHPACVYAGFSATTRSRRCMLMRSRAWRHFWACEKPLMFVCVGVNVLMCENVMSRLMVVDDVEHWLVRLLVTQRNVVRYILNDVFLYTRLYIRDSQASQRLCIYIVW